MSADRGSSASTGAKSSRRSAEPDAKQLDALTAPVPRTEVTNPWARFLGTLAVFALLYLFLVSISLLGTGFKLYGKGFAKTLITTTSNPFIGLFIGIDMIFNGSPGYLGGNPARDRLCPPHRG